MEFFLSDGHGDMFRPARLFVQTRMSRFADDHRVTDYSVLHDDGTFVPCEFRTSSGAGYPIELILAEVLWRCFTSTAVWIDLGSLDELVPLFK